MRERERERERVLVRVERLQKDRMREKHPLKMQPFLPREKKATKNQETLKSSKKERKQTKIKQQQSGRQSEKKRREIRGEGGRGEIKEGKGKLEGLSKALT